MRVCISSCSKRVHGQQLTHLSPGYALARCVNSYRLYREVSWSAVDALSPGYALARCENSDRLCREVRCELC